MFLAWNEIIHSKFRYLLITGVIFLIAYLVFFLTGLAYGLAQENRTAIDQWQADQIILTKDANTNISASTFSSEQLEAITAEEKAILGITSTVLQEKGNKDNEKINVRLLGVEAASFLAPTISEGRQFAKANEVVLDDSLKEEYGLALNQQLTMTGSQEELTIVGFVHNAQFNMAPVVYTDFETFQQLRYGSQSDLINAILVRNNQKTATVTNSDLAVIPIEDFINKLPGYSAQNLTFSFMIGFLVVIAAIVIGIFIYVLTMQKTAIFGVMKAQGISSFTIAKSVLAQTFLLAVIGTTLGLLLTYLSALALPVAVPFQINWFFFGTTGVLMVVIAIISGLFSVKTIVKVDPLKAIG